MGVTFQIPTGPMNLETLFPSIDFDKVEEYYVSLREQGTDTTVLTTPSLKLGCCCGKDLVRIFFVNYLGGIDALNFKTLTISHEVTSLQWKKPLKAPMEKWDGGIQRSDITANDTFLVENRCYDEADNDWLQELVDAPNAWIQWFGTQGQDDDYLPIVILDGTFLKQKQQERYINVLQVQFKMANEKLIIRN